MITASVVLYNTQPHLLENLIKSYCPSEDRYLYIVDNSEKKSEYCKNINISSVEYIFNNANIGYGAAHNIAIRKAIEIGSEYHIVLNPDIEFEQKVLDELRKYADENKDVVYMLPKVLYPNGELQYLCKLLPTPFDLIFRRFLPKFKWVEERDRRYTLQDFGYDKIINPPCLSGCFMFMRVSALMEHKIEFDDRFFMYFEDFDLIRRLHRVGKTIFYPNVNIIHNHAKESYKTKKMLKVHIFSAIKYFNKYGWFIDRERKKMNQKILSSIK